MAKAKGQSLTPELLDLMEHEKVIEQGLTTFIDVGNALVAIRDGYKYRAAGYKTFEEYCQRRWEITKRHAGRLMRAAEIVDELEKGPVGPILPERESQVRPLASVPPPVAVEAWAEAVEEAGGEQPTAKQVEQAVAKRKEPQAVPKKAHGDEGVAHPAVYSEAVLDVFWEALPSGAKVLDPFAGVGTIHELRPEIETYGIELEEKWARVNPLTTHGNSRYAHKLFKPRSFDAIATSPAYGNRLADDYNAYDPHARRSYAIDLGQSLQDDNGAGMHFATDGQYEELHEAVWLSVSKLLRPGGLFLLNCKDFQRDGKIMRPVGWHVRTLTGMGLRVTDIWTLPTDGLPFTNAANLSEVVIAMEK